MSLEDDVLSLTPSHVYSSAPGSREVYVACKWDALIGLPAEYMCEAINEAQEALQTVFLESMH